jgi:hypothetical protein
VSESGDRDLTYHHAEIARVAKVLAAARPDSRRANLLRAVIKYHEEVISRPRGILSP